jgi:hypothetical protein
MRRRALPVFEALIRKDALGGLWALQLAPTFNGYRFRIGETGTAWVNVPAKLTGFIMHARLRLGCLPYLHPFEGRPSFDKGG